MKNFIIYILVFLFLSKIHAIGANGEEHYNSPADMRVARKISHIEGVSEVAVLSHNKRVLVGIRLDRNVAEDLVKKGTILAIESELKDIRKTVIEIETNKALDIIELAYCMEGNIKKQALIKRFNHLIET